MNYEQLSTNGLLLLHSGIAHALATDDNTPIGREKLYFARESADWKLLGDLLESILDRRKVKYTRLPW